MLNKIFLSYTLILFFLCELAIAVEWNAMGSGEGIKSCAGYNKKCIEKIKFGREEFSIKSSGDDTFQLLHNKKTIKTLEGYSLSIQESHSIKENGIILLALNSGGRACPMEMYIIQISGSSNAITEPFGSCSDYYKTYIEKNVFIVRTPIYFNPIHLKERKNKDRKEIENTGENEYRWSNSKLTELNNVKKR